MKNITLFRGVVRHGSEGIKVKNSKIPIDDIITIVKDVGDKVLEIYNLYCQSESTLKVQHKKDQSPLTLADLTSHLLIKEKLLQLTPKVPVVSEEDKNCVPYPIDSGEFWLVDPLDGTKEFLAKNGEFTINIALVENGEPVFGIVYAPALDLIYWGGRSIGAWRAIGGESQTLRVATAVASPAAWRVVASRSHMNETTKNYIATLGAVKLVQAGSSLKLCKVAEGSADIYPRLAPTCEWDTAAAQAVVEGAGGYVFDLLGRRLSYGKTEVLNPYFIASCTPLIELSVRG